MESISVAFSIFLSSITGGMQLHVSDVMGGDLETQIIEYQDHKIDYHYQFWKIKPASVCSTTKHELVSEYSQCTVAAKSFFIETCSHLTNNKRNHWKHKKLENMYCSAAVSYEPTIAQISIPTAKEAELLEAQQACSMLTLQARQTRSPQHATQRDKACAEYKALSAVTK
ncbi:hypothetical protein [Methylophaga muralis]|uniref:Uncharacterized protein n=1 Tax=Methylophaga muralis TaxID=291169 RepID=A0A1E3GUJ9_9GAMM|nr:hypothetical protein [Methylophaga muralis]ODN67748.1 hypothetical protein A9E74_00584 [Methylophaga muralis]